MGARHESRDSQLAPPTPWRHLPYPAAHSSTASGTAIYPWSQHAYTEKSALHWLDFGRRGPLLHGPGIRRIAIGGESAADPPKNRHERYRRGPGCNWTMPSGALPQSADAHCAVSKTPRHASNGLRRFLGGRQLRTPPKKKRTAHPRWRPLDSGSVHLSMKAIYFQTTSGLSPWPYD